MPIDQPTSARRPRFWQTVYRSIRLQCPACGKGEIARIWRETYEECPNCGFDFCVEGGFYLGSIYVNYAISSAVLLGIGVPLVGWGYVAPGIASIVGVLLCIPLSIWLWRYARSLWLGFGFLIDHNVRAGSRFLPTERESFKGQQNAHSADPQAFHCVCPYCHHRMPCSATRQSTWDDCEACQERIFLIPVADLSCSDRGS